MHHQVIFSIHCRSKQDTLYVLCEWYLQATSRDGSERKTSQLSMYAKQSDTHHEIKRPNNDAICVIWSTPGSAKLVSHAEKKTSIEFDIPK